MEDRITSLSEVELVSMGQRLRSPYLLQQAGYTISLARAEGEALTKLMRPGLVDLVEKARQSVAKTYEDKAVMVEEAKLSTGSQQTAMRSLKEWGRKTAARANAAALAGATVPEQLTLVPTSRSVPGRIAQAQALLGLLEQHGAVMDQFGAPTKPLLDEGRTLCEALIAADSGQELKRGSKLPVALASFYARKAELYLGLKMINQAGHEFYAHDLASASRFNLSLLYRRFTGGPGETQPETATTAPTPSVTTPTAPTATAPTTPATR